MARDKLTVGRLIDVLRQFPPNATFSVVYEDFGCGEINGIDYDVQRGEVALLHDMTGVRPDDEEHVRLYGASKCDKPTAER